VKDAAASAQEAITGVADSHGDRLTGALASAAAFLSQKSQGRTDKITSKVEEFTAKTVDSLKSDAGSATAPSAQGSTDAGPDPTVTAAETAPGAAPATPDDPAPGA
jgi:hypothetical protein